MITEEKINTLFDTLDKWRMFPAYQLERRADIFFAIYLKEVLESTFKTTIDSILPEFPIRIGSLYNEGHKNDKLNLSFKVDYFAISQKNNTIYFIELKTDVTSKREKQDWYLTTAQNVKIKILVEGLLKIYRATEQKQKYKRYIKELIKFRLIKLENGTYKEMNNNFEIEVVNIQPKRTKFDKFKVITFANIIEILSAQKDFLSNRFIQSLKKWKTNPNN